MDLEIIDPTEFPHWDELLLSIPEATIFHTSSWARVLKDSYGYCPVYFTGIEKAQISFLLPIMEINSFITGKRGVSLPFTDYCRVICPQDATLIDILGPVIEYGKKARWNYLEIRDGRHLIPGGLTYYSYVGHMLDLTRGTEMVYSDFRDSTKRNIKKAAREGIRIHIEQSKTAIDQFYGLNCMTRKEHGLPPQPRSFFTKIYEHIISQNRGFIVLGSFKERVIASAVFFHYGGNCIYKYGASDKNFHRLRTGNLIIWEAIKHFCREGLKSICFGRTELGNKGLRQFKGGWGAEETQIQYFKYNLRQGVFVSGKQKGKPAYTGLFRAIPPPILNIIGSLLYRHMG